MASVTFDLTDRETIFSSLPPGGIGAELGVDWCDFSKIILANAKPKLLYLIDCWTLQSKEVYGDDPANTHHDVKYKQCLMRYLTDSQVKIAKASSEEAAPCFADGYFDWFYIDANHMQAYRDIQLWMPKVKSGGFLMGHDYCANEFITVKVDVDRFVSETGLTLQVTDDPICKCWIIQKP